MNLEDLRCIYNCMKAETLKEIEAKQKLGKLIKIQECEQEIKTLKKSLGFFNV